MNKLFFILVIPFFSACGPQKKESTEEKTGHKEKTKDTLELNNTRVDPKTYGTFRSMIKRLKTVSLPLKFRLHEGIDPKGMLEFEFGSPEVELLMKDQVNFVYGLLPDTSSYYAIITFVPADAMAPFLFTYTKSGKMISYESLFVRGCGFDCGIVQCTSDCLIDRNLNVILVDTNHYFQCHDDGSEIKGSREFYYEKKTYRIDARGKIANLKESKVTIKP